MRVGLSVGLALALGCGCADANTYTCQASIPCGASMVQTCCSTTQCEYRIGNQVVSCHGVDCTAAAAQVQMLCPAACDGGASLDASGCLR